tara:strand:+ start:2462 stop:2803 length:342 start_codon:yes stop_codon:yes gene_type:complete
MIPETYNYGNWYRGDTLDAAQFNIKENTVPLDLTGVTIKCQFRIPFNGKTIKEINIGSGITVSNPSSGAIIFDAFTLNWDAGLYLYDVEFTYPSGTIKTYIKGTINVISDKTI